MAAEEYGALNAELAEPEELAAEVVLAYDGLSPTAKVEETEVGAKITVVDKHGTTTATVKNGKDGATGAPGAHIGPEAPTNGEKLWVDTDEAPEESETESGTQIDVVAKAGQLLSVAEVDADGKPTKWQAVDLPKAETPNFSANEGEKGYIEGRTHYVDAKGIVHKLDNKFIDAEWMATSREHIDPNVFIAEQKLTSGMWQKRQQDIQPGLVYDVHINDVVYPCEAFTEDGGVCIGNNTSLNKNNIPFCIYWAGGSATAGFFYKKSTLAYPIYMKVTGHSWTEYNKLPEEFLPDGVVKSVNGNKPDEKGNVTVEIPESTGGGVDVTASVGQTIIVEEVDASGKPTKWKAADYQPRTHWTEAVPTVLIDNQSFGEYDKVIFEFMLVAGQSYHIVFNGVEYDEVARSVDLNGTAAVLIGNDVIIGGDDTGEPYAIMSIEGVGSMPGSAYGGDYTLTLSTMQEVVIKLPAKYIPDEVAAYAPYYVNMFMGIDDAENPAWRALTTVAQLEAMIDAGRMVIVKVVSTSFGTYYLHFCHDHTTADGKRRIGFSGGEALLQLVPQDDGTYIGETNIK